MKRYGGFIGFINGCAQVDDLTIKSDSDGDGVTLGTPITVRVKGPRPGAPPPLPFGLWSFS